MTREMAMAALAVVLAAWPAAAQQVMQIQTIDDPPRLAAYWELGGNAFVSGNLDLLVTPHTSVRAGAIMIPLASDVEGIPWNGLLTVNRLFGDRGKYFEVGAGVVAIHSFDDRMRTYTGPTANLGFRIQTPRRFLRATVAASPPAAKGNGRFPIFGVSFGRTF